MVAVSGALPQRCDSDIQMSRLSAKQKGALRLLYEFATRRAENHNIPKAERTLKWMTAGGLHVGHLPLSVASDYDLDRSYKTTFTSLVRRRLMREAWGMYYLTGDGVQVAKDLSSVSAPTPEVSDD